MCVCCLSQPLSTSLNLSQPCSLFLNTPTHSFAQARAVSGLCIQHITARRTREPVRQRRLWCIPRCGHLVPIPIPISHGSRPCAATLCKRIGRDPGQVLPHPRPLAPHREQRARECGVGKRSVAARHGDRCAGQQLPGRRWLGQSWQRPGRSRLQPPAAEQRSVCEGEGAGARGQAGAWERVAAVSGQHAVAAAEAAAVLWCGCTAAAHARRHAGAGAG